MKVGIQRLEWKWNGTTWENVFKVEWNKSGSGLEWKWIIPHAKPQLVFISVFLSISEIMCLWLLNQWSSVCFTLVYHFLLWGQGCLFYFYSLPAPSLPMAETIPKMTKVLLIWTTAWICCTKLTISNSYLGLHFVVIASFFWVEF